MREQVDLIVANAHLLTMRGRGTGYLAGGAMAVRHGQIVAIDDTAKIDESYQADARIDATDAAVVPGLIDAHMHTRYAIVRGVAQDVSNWMQKALAPYSRHLDDDAARAGTRLNLLEAIRCGTTTMSDFLDPYPGWGECYAEAGVRAVLTPTINALPPGAMAGWKLGEPYPLDDAVGRRAIDEALTLCDRWQGAQDGRITTMLGPQGADMVTREQLADIAAAAAERDLKIHMHVAQGDREIEQMVKRYGMRTAEFLADVGMLNERLLAVHLTEATVEETDQIADGGVSMVLCSGSIGIIDGIVPPAARFVERGGCVALGSDQASGNNCNNMFNEMKLTALFNKIHARDPEVMPAWQVLRMATIDGARALGLADRIGSLEAGKQADFIVVNLREANLMPVLMDPIRTIVPNLVYAGTGKEVTTVVVAGQVLYEDGEYTTLNREAIIDDAALQAERVSSRVRADPVHRELALLEPMRAGQM